MLGGPPFPHPPPLRVNFDNNIGPHPFRRRTGYPAPHLRRQGCIHPCHIQVNRPARFRAPGVVVMIRVAVFPHHLALRVDLQHHAALEPLP